MTEREWQAATEPHRLLEYVPYKVSKRKWRLMAVAFARRIWHLLADERSRRAVEAAEEWVEGQLSSAELKRLRDEAWPWPSTGWRARIQGTTEAAGAAATAAGAGKRDTGSAAGLAVSAVQQAGGSVEAERKHQCELIRDILGYPYREVPLDRAWLAWNDGTIPKMARTIYDERAFDQMPVLADALEDAGCTNAEILSHCRGPGPHVRGCWVIDLLIGRE